MPLQKIWCTRANLFIYHYLSLGFELITYSLGKIDSNFSFFRRLNASHIKVLFKDFNVVNVPFFCMYVVRPNSFPLMFF